MIIEYSEAKYKTMLGTFLLVMDAFTNILLILFFKYVGNANIMDYIGMGINILGVIAIWWLPETPEFLYNTYQFKEARAVLARIAQINGVLEYDDTNMLFDTEIEMMRCKLSELTPANDMR